MESPVTENHAESLEPDEAFDEQELTTNYQRPSDHERRLAEVLKLSSRDLLDALEAKSHTDNQYIASEVLVSLVRGNYGVTNRVRDEIALRLNRRIIAALYQYLRRYPQWHAIMNRSSEALAEIVSYTQLKIFENKADVCFAEVAFSRFVGMRILDWFKSEVRDKNSALSIDSVEIASDEADDSFSLQDQVRDHRPSPDKALEIRQLLQRCIDMIELLPEKQRTALVLCEFQEMTHKEAAEVMQLSESSVQKHVKAALTALRNGDWYE